LSCPSRIALLIARATGSSGGVLGGPTLLRVSRTFSAFGHLTALVVRLLRLYISESLGSFRLEFEFCGGSFGHQSSRSIVIWYILVG